MDKQKNHHLKQLKNKSFKYWSKEIKENPKNEEIFHYWLKALIAETKTN